MEARAQEVATTCEEGRVKDRRLSGVLLLVCPEVLFVGHPKGNDSQADLKVLCVVLEKSKGFWPLVQARTT